jgi:hypothetical protein
MNHNDNDDLENNPQWNAISKALFTPSAPPASEAFVQRVMTGVAAIPSRSRLRYFLWAPVGAFAVAALLFGGARILQPDKAALEPEMVSNVTSYDIMSASLMNGHDEDYYVVRPDSIGTDIEAIFL